MNLREEFYEEVNKLLANPNRTAEDHKRYDELHLKLYGWNDEETLRNYLKKL